MDDDQQFLGSWIKKSLEAGDSPKIIREVLKKRGYDPEFVNIVIKSGIVQKKEAAPKKIPEQEFCNTELKSEVESLLARKPKEMQATSPESGTGASSDSLEEALHAVERIDASDNVPRPEKQAPTVSVFGSIWGKIRGFLEGIELPEMPKIPFPRVDIKAEDFQSMRYVIMAAILIVVLLAVSFGLDWYADRAARAVLG